MLGPQHPDTAQSLNNLAILYYHQGQFEHAIPLMERSLAIREAVLGPDHPDTKVSRLILHAIRRAALLGQLPAAIRTAYEQQDQAAFDTALQALSPEEQQRVVQILTAIQQRQPPDPVAQLAPLLDDIAAIAAGDESPRGKVEQALADLEAQGFMLREPVARIWQGERDPARLTAGLDATDTRIIAALVERIGKR